MSQDARTLLALFISLAFIFGLRAILRRFNQSTPDMSAMPQSLPSLPVSFYIPRRTYVIMVVFGAFMVAVNFKYVALGMPDTGHGRYSGLPCDIFFFGAGALMGLYALLALLLHWPMLTVTAEGIYRGPRQRFVPWHDIQSIERYEVYVRGRPVPYVRLHLAPAAITVGASRENTVSIPARLQGVSTNQLFAWLQQYLVRYNGTAAQADNS